MSTAEQLGTPTEPTPAAAAPATPADYQALYEAELRKTADLINQRNLLKPAQTLLNNLDEGSKAAIMELAEAARAGDTEAILEWNLRTIQQVSGKDAATLIAERQQREGLTGAAPTPTPDVKYLTAEEAERIADQRIAARDTMQQQQAQVAQQLATHGYKLDSAVGETIIRYAVQTNCPLADAVTWFENDMATTALERARAAAAAGQAIPGTSPTGVPVATTPDVKAAGESDEDFRRRSIMSKLMSAPTN